MKDDEEKRVMAEAIAALRSSIRAKEPDKKLFSRKGIDDHTLEQQTTNREVWDE